MGKHSGKKDREDKARRRLVKAQLDLHMAQEKRADAISRAERELERAKQRGSKWVANATERVERRAGAMAQAEAHLLAITAPKRYERTPMQSTVPDTGSSQSGPSLTVSSPTVAADVLERREAEAEAQRNAGPLTIPEGNSIDVPDASNGSDTSEESDLRPW